MCKQTAADGPRSRGQRCCSLYMGGEGNLIERLFHNLVLNFIGAIVYLSPTPMGEVSPNLGINEILGK